MKFIVAIAERFGNKLPGKFSNCTNFDMETNLQQVFAGTLICWINDCFVALINQFNREVK